MVAAILPESLDGTTFQTQTGNRLNEALLPPQCETKVTVRDSTPKKKKAVDNAGMCPCCTWYLYILIPFALAFVILPFIAFFHENAGPHLLSSNLALSDISLMGEAPEGAAQFQVEKSQNKFLEHICQVFKI